MRLDAVARCCSPWSMPPTSPCDHVQCLVHTRECARMRLNAAACASHVAGRARAFVCIQTRIRHPSTLALALSPHKPSDSHASVCIQVGAERIQIEPYSGHAVFSAHSEVGG